MGPLWGKVQKIGFRASVIRSFEGADVVVPNGQLTSQEVVNWSRSDQLRRMDVSVGVAYGTDPHQVMRTLLEVAKGHSEVLKKPAPDVLFERFGDSSLEFTLRCWTRLHDFLRVRSEVTTAVNDAFQRAGIVIPFPQRDLHVRWSEPADQAATGLQPPTQQEARGGASGDAPANRFLQPDRGPERP
jgi:small-conductance mechanosensitive channel